MLDVGGWRAARKDELTAIGTRAASKVASTGEQVRLAPMTPFERKVVHDAVAAVEGVSSESEGVEPERRVVVLPTAPDRTPHRDVPDGPDACPTRRRTPRRPSARRCRCCSGTPRCSPGPASSAACSARARRRGCGSGTCSTAPARPRCSSRAASSPTSAPAPACPASCSPPLRPDVTVVLVEPLLRRAVFLEEVVAELGLRTALVRRARAEELAGDLLVDAVTARAVAPLDRLAGWALPLLHPGGRLLALKGERADEELQSSGAALRAAGAASAEVVAVGDPALQTEGRVVVVTRGTAALPSKPKAKRGRR